jgi:hypothetical protein
MSGQPCLVRALLEAGAEVNSVATLLDERLPDLPCELTPLEWAVKLGNTGIPAIVQNAAQTSLS